MPRVGSNNKVQKNEEKVLSRHLEETAVNENHTFPKEWVSEDGSVGQNHLNVKVDTCAHWARLGVYRFIQL